MVLGRKQAETTKKRTPYQSDLIESLQDAGVAEKYLNGGMLGHWWREIQRRAKIGRGLVVAYSVNVLQK
ncbi:MAG: hypothetical protein R3B95_07605 [Nitrospirales bacterium]|nr:hypothetical protein [Nitrospirales bacterium]